MTMNPTRANVYILGECNYAVINRVLYRLTPLDDEEIAEVFNGGDVIPLLGPENI